MRLPSKSTTFWILLGASAVTAFVLPARWTTWVRGLFQPLALLQMPMSWAARGTAQTLDDATAGAVSAKQAHSLLKENEALQRQVAQQRLRLEAVEQRLAELTRLGGQLPDSHLRIVIAPVAAYDVTPARATLQITLSERQARLVRKDQWVVAAGAPRPDWDPQALLRDLVDREWLVGRVSEVQPRVASVQLTTDPRFRSEVRTARVLADGTWQLANERCRLLGRGGGRMLIDQAEEDYFKSAYCVVVVPPSRELPMPLSVGQIEGSTPRDDSPQHFDLTVVPWERFDRLTHVYVIASEP